MVRLRFTYNPTWYNRVIKFFTWYKYTHVDVELSPGVYISAIPGKGVIIHSMSARDEMFMELDIDSKPVIEFMMSQLGKPYDWMGIFAMPFRGSWQDDSKWFCSELVAAAINKAIRIFLGAESRITTRDVCMNVYSRSAK